MKTTKTNRQRGRMRDSQMSAGKLLTEIGRGPHPAGEDQFFRGEGVVDQVLQQVGVELEQVVLR